jgi:hypothetical protein
MEADRAIVRLFRQRQGDDAPRELARTVAELFETAYLLELEDRGDEQPRCPPQQAKPQAPVSAPSHRVAPHWYVSLSGMGGLVGEVGPSVQVAGGAGVLLDIASNLGLKLGVGGGFGPFGEGSGYAVDGWVIVGEAELLLYLLNRGARMGPVIGISGGLQSVRVEADGSATSYRYPKADAIFGLGFNVPVATARTTLRIGVLVSPYRTEVTDGNDGDIMYRNSALGWFVSNDWYFF